MNEGKLICTGIRGAVPGDEVLERDLAACRQAGVGGVILFDVDVPTWHRLRRDGLSDDEARRRAVRNIISPDQVRALTAHIREQLGPDVFIAVDQEGGRVARLSAARGFAADPAARDLGALPQEALQAAARQQARQLAELGFDLNFAPCVDLDLEPDNPIIGQLGRSFGAEPVAVVSCAKAVLAAHRAAGVAACLKHFPGHGSSRGDTHAGAVDITATWQREPELAPYRELLGLPGLGVMVGHVVHTRLGGPVPASLSGEIVDGLLRRELGFDGVVVTDAIDMLAVADHFSPGEAAVAAVAAGVDLVVDGFNLTERAEHPAPVLARSLARGFDTGRIPGGATRLKQSLQRLRKLRAEI